jgi:hypothetical protein
MKALDIMVDIEALGDAVCQIGACSFDRDTGEIHEEFLVNITPKSCIDAGLGLRWGPVNFWLQEASNGSPLTWTEDPIDLYAALQLFNNFFIQVKEKHGGYRGVWSHATYDMPQLHKAYRAAKVPQEWNYKRERDIRTLVDLAKVTLKKVEHKEKKTHDALDDCRYQVEYSVECFKKLKGK